MYTVVVLLHGMLVAIDPRYELAKVYISTSNQIIVHLEEAI